MRIEKEKREKRWIQNQERQAKVNLYEEKEKENETEEARTYATVVGILESHVRTYSHVGTLSFDKPGTPVEEQVGSIGRLVWFRPNDKRVPYLLVPSQLIPSEILAQKDYFETNLYTCKILEWTDCSLYPKGTFTGHLGQIGELSTESEALLVSSGIVWEEFSEPVLGSLVETV
jgi:exoribonuclease R